jgi:hypothetical protein
MLFSLFIAKKRPMKLQKINKPKEKDRGDFREKSIFLKTTKKNNIERDR